MIKKTTFLALLLVAPLAHAENWTPVSAGEGAVVSIDTDSIKRVGPKKLSAWVYWQFDEPTPIYQGSSKTFSSSKELTLFNCADGSNRAVDRQMYADKASTGAPVLNAKRQDDPKDYSHPEAGTMAAQAIAFVCAWKPGKR